MDKFEDKKLKYHMKFVIKSDFRLKFVIKSDFGPLLLGSPVLLSKIFQNGVLIILISINGNLIMTYGWMNNKTNQRNPLKTK